FSADKNTTHQQKIDQLYLQAFSRKATADESAKALAYIAANKDQKQAYEDIVWALINTKEFLFNH
ncbi:MAG: hypothetical protein SGJ20_17210, partial [Planctomycetota bacterium]|nr:hypothetical protein [Planctomycetota bacterium]